MIKILKSGKFALDGINIVKLEEGKTESFELAEEKLLVDVGWAEYCKDDAVDIAEDIDEIREEVDWLEVFTSLEDKDFTTTGKPRVKAVEAIVGRDLTSKEVNDAWKEYQD